MGLRCLEAFQAISLSVRYLFISNHAFPRSIRLMGVIMLYDYTLSHQKVQALFAYLMQKVLADNEWFMLYPEFASCKTYEPLCRKGL